MYLRIVKFIEQGSWLIFVDYEKLNISLIQVIDIFEIWCLLYVQFVFGKSSLLSQNQSFEIHSYA